MELPWLDMYEVWRVLGSYLTPAGARETDTDRELRERIEATACLRRVAAHLRLPEGQAPTIAAYTRARAELDLPLSARQVETRWEGWHFAKLALAGEKAVETPAQRSIRRAATGRKYQREEYLTGIRDWLIHEPASETTADYDEWVKDRNSDPERAPCRRAVAIESRLSLSWSRVLAVARFEAELPEAHLAYAEELRKASGVFDLVGAVDIALIFGTSRQEAQRLVRKPCFPPHVAVLSRARVWYRSDVEAHHVGQPHPEHRQEGELQARIVQSSEVSERLGCSLVLLTSYLHDGRRGPAPQPAGRVSTKLYWVREDFEQWVRDVFEPWKAGLPERRRLKREQIMLDAKGHSEGV